ncbi:hypothetical protein [Burkholderia stagnalis]|uniref:hypothetical protein n=1 Tax=Burkholderia stagnalis TaxID=1503054 RepID=UPI00325B414D
MHADACHCSIATSAAARVGIHGRRTDRRGTPCTRSSGRGWGGRYVTPQDVDNWKIAVLRPDLALAKKNGQSYRPVVFPGFSWHDLFRGVGMIGCVAKLR